MSSATEFVGMSSQEEGAIYRRSEEVPPSMGNRDHEDFVKWVSAHEEQVRKMICRSRDFSGETFCARSDLDEFEHSLFWSGAEL